MLNKLPPEILKIRSEYLRDVRSWFHGRGYLEVETPLLNSTGGFEPFLDPMRVKRSGVHKSVESSGENISDGYLITSPEYNLKITLGDVQQDIFQIAHSFREGDRGGIHSEEFLMLEWYKVGADEFELMQETHELLCFLSERSYCRRPLLKDATPAARSVKELMKEFCDCGFSREELEAAVHSRGLFSVGEELSLLRYDELFFTLFLNLVEGQLGRGRPEFVYHYPRELAALSVTQGDFCRRFEVFWEGVELANGYFELRDHSEQVRRFNSENALRRRLNKPEMEFDPQFMEALKGNFPSCSGIALGLDRLLMLLLKEESISKVSPFL